MPMAVMGAVETDPNAHTGINYWNANLGTYQNVLKDTHVLTIEHVQTF